MENNLFEKIRELKILVVGDIMLDRYIIGDVERISPEAPVPIVDVVEEYDSLGGCGNVAKNLTMLEANAYCVAVTGVDLHRDKIMHLLSLNGIKPFLINDRKRPTTVKERIISDQRHVQLLRIDREKRAPVDPDYIITEINHILQVKGITPDIIIVSDYHKGVVTRPLMRFLEGMPSKLIIDPKPSNASSYKKGFAITPNKKEYHDMENQIKNENFDNIIITSGKDGIKILKSDTKPYEIPGNEVQIYNVTGCGDVVVAVVAVCVGIGISILKSGKIANKCAAYTATSPGTSVISKEKFESFVQIVMDEHE